MMIRILISLKFLELQVHCCFQSQLGSTSSKMFASSVRERSWLVWSRTSAIDCRVPVRSRVPLKSIKVVRNYLCVRGDRVAPTYLESKPSLYLSPLLHVLALNHRLSRVHARVLSISILLSVNRSFDCPHHPPRHRNPVELTRGVRIRSSTRWSNGRRNVPTWSDVLGGASPARASEYLSSCRSICHLNVKEETASAILLGSADTNEPLRCD